jgi:hypothetical protein
MYADLLSEKITDIVTADTKSGSREKCFVIFILEVLKLSNKFKNGTKKFLARNDFLRISETHGENFKN